MRTKVLFLSLVSSFLLLACQQDTNEQRSSASLENGATCQLQGVVRSESGIEFNVNSCVAYQGYTRKEVQEQCAADKQKWSDFAGSGSVELTLKQPVECPLAVASCKTIEAIDTQLNITKKRILYHYDVSSAELDSRQKGCETRRGEFRILHST